MSKNNINRLIWLLDTINRHERLTFAQINDIWLRGDKERTDLSLKTFHNHRHDIEDMFDINIECHKSTNEYYIENSEDIFGDKLKSWLLNSFSVSNILKESTDIKNRVLFEEIPAGLQFFGPITEAIRDSVRVKIYYKGFGWKEAIEYVVEPYFMRLFKQRWYLTGMSLARDGIRSYSLDRIQRIEQTHEKFIYPAKFNPHEYYKDCYGIVRMEKEKPQRTILKCSPGETPYLLNLPLHQSQTVINSTPDYTTFELYICHTYDFVKELLSFGAEIEVLEPVGLRERLRNETKKCQNYTSKPIKKLANI